MKLFIFFMVFLMTVIVFFPSPSIAARRSNVSELTQARNYVFSACIMDRYSGTSIATEADAWANGLVENGSLSAESYHALSNLVKSAPAPGITQSGISMILQSCFDFVNSKKLDKRLKIILSH